VLKKSRRPSCYVQRIRISKNNAFSAFVQDILKKGIQVRCVSANLLWGQLDIFTWMSFNILLYFSRLCLNGTSKRED